MVAGIELSSFNAETKPVETVVNSQGFCTAQQVKMIDPKDAEIKALKLDSAALGARLAALEQAMERLSSQEQK